MHFAIFLSILFQFFIALASTPWNDALCDLQFGNHGFKPVRIRHQEVGSGGDPEGRGTRSSAFAAQVFFFFLIFIYLFILAALGLSCGTRDLF